MAQGKQETIHVSTEIRFPRRGGPSALAPSGGAGRWEGTDMVGQVLVIRTDNVQEGQVHYQKGTVFTPHSPGHLSHYTLTKVARTSKGDVARRRTPPRA